MAIPSIVAVLVNKSLNNIPVAIRSWILLGMVCIWGLRLALHIGLRHKQEDFRYVDMRKRYSEAGQCSYYTKAFCYIFML